jgi:hypothetical protein
MNVLTSDEAAGRRPPDPPPPDDTPADGGLPREYTVVVTVVTTALAAHLDVADRLAATVRAVARERPGALPASTIEMRSGEPS